MKRRTFITLIGGAAAWPLAARAQQHRSVVGILGVASAQGYSTQTAAFKQGLAEAGYSEGQNISFEMRWANDQSDRLPALAVDLVRRQVAVIAALGTPEALAAKAATTTIPVVFYTGADPIGAGLVASLNRPGGNLTGVTSLNVGVNPKRLELLHELLPTAKVFALLINPANAVLSEVLSRELQATADSLGLELHIFRAHTENDFEPAFEALDKLRAGGLVIGVDAFFTSQMQRLAALALRHGIPTVYQAREFARAGGLMSYGGSLTDQYRLAGLYTGRILKGEHPSELPVQQFTKVELIINLNTAKALGITFPITLLGRADEVIE